MKKFNVSTRKNRSKRILDNRSLFYFYLLYLFVARAKSSREDRSATTFWMDKALKEIAQDKASKIDMTLTDLINRAVDFYLREGHKLDDEIGQKLAMVELAEDIRESGKYEFQLAEISQIQKGLQARVSEIEKTVEEITTGELLQQTIRAHISAKVDPLLERLGELLVRLKPIE